MAAVVKEGTLLSLELEVLASAVGVVMLETHVFPSLVAAKKLHRASSSRLNALPVCLTWVKCSGTHQDRNLAWWENMPEPTVYLYDGTGENVIEEADSNGNVLARYAERVLDEPFAEFRSSTTSYYEQDGLDSVTSLTNSTGVLASSYAFDSIGNLTASSGAITNPFRYTGRDFDSETGLYFYRARYLDSGTGRFLSEDPLRFAGDGPDFYAYTLNNPVTYVDPMGTSAICPSFLPWCIPNPPNPPTPGSWGGPEPGGWVPNAPPPQTGPLSGPALNLADCMAHALGRYFVVTGGSECTPDGRHVPGGVTGSKHCTNQAIDIRPAGQDQQSLFCAALNCGAQNIINEGDHYHMQTVRGPGGAQGLLPKRCNNNGGGCS